MPRLPIPDQDNEIWGNLLNEFLNVSHRDDGTLKGTLDVINVMDFGAIGDGVADDTPAIQAALDECFNTNAYPRGAHTPAMVVFPPGLYKVFPQPNEAYCLRWRTGVSIVGAGPGRETNTNSSPWGGTCLMAAAGCNVPVIYADTAVHLGAIRDLRISQDTSSSTSNISNCHGIHIDASPTIGEASGLGELALIDRVYVKGVGGDGIKFGNEVIPLGGQQISSQPLYLGLISVHQNGGYGVNFIGENHGHAYIQTIKGDGNREALIRFEEVTGEQSSVRINSVGVESGAVDGGWWGNGGHNDTAIEIVNSPFGNIHIGQLHVSVTSNRNSDSTIIRVIRHEGDDNPLDRGGPRLSVDKFAYLLGNGKTGYTHFYLDENIEYNSETWPVALDTVDGGNAFNSVSHVFRNPGWNVPSAGKPSTGLVFSTIRNKKFSIASGDNFSNTGLRFNYGDDGATTAADIRFYDGDAGEIFHISPTGPIARSMSLIDGDLTTRTVTAQISLPPRTSKHFQMKWSRAWASLSGDMTVHGIGTLNFAAQALFAISSSGGGTSSLNMMGETSAVSTALAIHSPAIVSLAENTLQFRFENTHYTKPLNLMIICRITGNQGMAEQWVVVE